MFRMQMTFLLFVLLALLITAGAQSPTTAPGKSGATVADVAWLAGCWEGRQGEAVIEEVWSKPGGGSMIGFGRTVKENRTTSFEFMQFREYAGSLAFMPQPQGGQRVTFPLKDSFGGKFIFENKEHDFPQRVIYERKGPGLLLAAIEGTSNGKAGREEFQMRKVRCDPKE